MNRLIICAALLSLGACAHRDREFETAIAAAARPIDLPDISDSYQCTVAPPRPVPIKGKLRVTEGQVARYIVALEEAGDDCRSRLALVSKVYEEARSRAIPPDG